MCVCVFCYCQTCVCACRYKLYVCVVKILSQNGRKHSTIFLWPHGTRDTRLVSLSVKVTRVCALFIPFRHKRTKLRFNKPAHFLPEPTVGLLVERAFQFAVVPAKHTHTHTHARTRTSAQLQ